jgi:hypothetical protein
MLTRHDTMWALLDDVRIAAELTLRRANTEAKVGALLTVVTHLALRRRQ